MKAWVLCAVASLAFGEENIIKNPGFELTEGGKTVGWDEHAPAYKYEDGAGRNGTRGLSFNNADPKFYSFPHQSVEVTPGVYYKLDGWVKTQDLKGEDSGASFCVEWQDAKGKWLGGIYPDGVKGTSADWEEIIGTFKMPTNAMHVTFCPYVRKGMTGKAWFDDLSFARWYPAVAQNVTSSCYRNTSAGGPVTFFAALLLEEAKDPTAKVTGLFTLSGKGWSKEYPPAEMKPDCAKVTIDASAVPVGEYSMAFKLTRADGKVCDEITVPFHRVAKLPERRVYIDEHLRVIAEGKPFFPLGMYWGSVDADKLETYTQGPFNCLMAYASPDKNGLDLCQKKGIRVIYSVKDLYSGTRWAPKGIKTVDDEVAEITRRVNAYRGHPAVLAWYLNDELSLSMIDRLTMHQQLLERLDADHPTWVTLYQYNEVRGYLPSFDVIGTDPYPIPSKPAGTALEWTRTVREQTYGARANWQVPQAFDWGNYRKDEDQSKTRKPTLQELRSMTWQCIAGGANGIIYYSFFDLYKQPEKNPFDKQWADVLAAAREVKKLEPVLLSVEPAPEATGAPAEIAVRVWSLGGDIYVLAVNSSDKPVKATLKIGADFKAVAAELGTAPTKAGDRGLAFTFAPLEPIMARLSR